MAFKTIYVVQFPDGHTNELEFPVPASIGKVIETKKVEIKEPVIVESNKRKSVAGVTKRESFNAGVHASQVTEMREHLKKHDVKGVEVKQNGDIQFSDRRARKNYLKVRGFHDRDGGYGD